MADLYLPVRNDLPSYEFSVELELRIYVFRFRWNERRALWSMDIAQADGTDIVAGIPLFTNLNLIGRFKSDDLPPGKLVVLDESGAGADAGRFDLGANVRVVYTEAG